MATREIRSVLIARNDRLGDWVLTLPLLEELEAALPGVRLGAMARPAMAPLLERCRAVGTLIASGGKGWRGFRKTAAAVRAGDFDAAVVVHPDFVDTLVVWFAGVGVRVGNAYRGYSFLYNRRVKFHRSPSKRHEVEYNLRYLEGLGLRVPAEAPPPRLEVTAEDRAAARALLARRGVAGEGYVVVHPGSGGSSLNWSPRRYRILAAELGKALGGAVVVTGTTEEAELAAYVAGEGAGRAAVAGDTAFGTLLGLLEGARLFVSANTGPMHVAAAVGTPTLSLFSPLRSGSPTRWGPRGNVSAVVVPSGFACAKCTGERCKHFNCMEAITVEEVLAVARRVAAEA
jgi:ADP-heptose:LPS heptosyltransferase